MQLTFELLREKGIDTSNISICEKIRKLAKLDRIRLDESEHRSGLNKHLFDYLDYCGVNKLEFIKGYLSKLQPYMIERKKDQEKSKELICVIDNLYRVSVYIKLSNKQFEEMIVSFHEDNIRGVARTNSVIKNDKRDIVPIFADTILGRVESSDKYVVKAIFQRGLKTLPLELPAVKCGNIFLVSKKAIDLSFIDYCNGYIRDLYTSNLQLDFESIEIFSMLQQISFTSYGNDTFSSTSLLIDSLCVQSDYNSKSTADFALVTFVQNLALTEEQQKELIELLYEKFQVTSIKGIDKILQRVKDNLSLSYNQQGIINNTDDLTEQDLMANYVNRLILDDNK